MPVPHPPLHFTHPLPYGAIPHNGGVHFVVYSHSATAMRVLLYDKLADREPTDVIELDPTSDRWGDVWSAFVTGIGAAQLYHLQADGPFDPDDGHRFDGRARLIDPYARALAGDFQRCEDGIIRPPKCVIVDEEFDWQGDRHLRRTLADTVIYEMHVGGFTRSRTSRVGHPGTYLGIIEKIPYLQSLGVTAVELMPVHEFPVNDPRGYSHKVHNYWGYDPLAFFAPHRGYAANPEPGAQVAEFKQMVRALHQAGIEVILDVCFNHTAEGNERGPTLSFKGLENRVYYMLEAGGRCYRNYTGCGNTINGNHPIVREMIFHCLRHWVLNYHIDGFRFDLASILSRDRQGKLIATPPVVEAIAEDPLLADTKIIAEAWDAAGAYQVGSFHSLRWAEWNGRYRDDVRSFWRGDQRMVGPLATRLAGSSDLYEPSGREPYHSINFITSHDGFTLNDLVTYAHKHNEANGEANHDGENNNYSANYGIEGPTRRPSIDRLRVRQIKNMLATLLLSHGVPMLVAGDECRRTQRGNNNAWCQDSAVSWFDWRLVERHPELVRFCRALIAFRKQEPTVRRTTFLRGEPKQPGDLSDVSWFNADAKPVDWNTQSHSLTCLLAGVCDAHTAQRGRDLMILFHAGPKPRPFTIPSVARSRRWSLFINTANKSPYDVFPGLDGPALRGRLVLEDRSLLCYVQTA